MDLEVYSISNQHIVLKYLARKYPTQNSHDAYKFRQISDTDKAFMFENLFPKNVREIPPFPINEPDFDVVLNRYLQKENKTHTGELSNHDRRMVHTMFKLSKTYKHCERKRVVPLTKIDCQNIFESENTNTNFHAESVSVVNCKLCGAFKLNGEKCGSKVKQGNEFCMRHAKKNNMSND